MLFKQTQCSYLIHTSLREEGFNNPLKEEFILHAFRQAVKVSYLLCGEESSKPAVFYILGGDNAKQPCLGIDVLGYGVYFPLNPVNLVPILFIVRVYTTIY